MIVVRAYSSSTPFNEEELQAIYALIFMAVIVFIAFLYRSY
jgi:Ser/Thr protein kinase RdoA (MazF antagonist)